MEPEVCFIITNFITVSCDDVLLDHSRSATAYEREPRHLGYQAYQNQKAFVFFSDNFSCSTEEKEAEVISNANLTSATFGEREIPSK